MLSAPPQTTQYSSEQTTGTDLVADLKSEQSGSAVRSSAKDAEVQVGHTLCKKNARIQARPKCSTKG